MHYHWPKQCLHTASFSLHISFALCQNLGNNQHVETKVKFSSTIERDGCKYFFPFFSLIATHFEKEQYLTFVERTLAATVCLGDVFSIVIHLLSFYIRFKLYVHCSDYK